MITRATFSPFLVYTLPLYLFSTSVARDGLPVTMPICIECSYPVSHLYSAYSRADDRSLGKGVRLTQCPHCKRFADKYVEHDFVVIFIDLVLIKPQVCCFYKLFLQLQLTFQRYTAICSSTALKETSTSLM